jgi:antitoxin ParD1/3/4
MEKTVPTRNIVLTTQQEAFVARLVKKGRYQNASEVLRDGLRLLEDEIRRKDEALKLLGERLKVGMAQAEAGDFADGTLEDIFERAMAGARKRLKDEKNRADKERG